MAIGTANVITEMLAAAEIIVILFTGMAGKTRFGYFFRILTYE